MNNWRTVRLGDIAKDGRGYYGIGASAVPFSPEKYTYLRITDINDDGTLNKADLKSVDAENAENYLLSPNDVVFARTGNSTGRNYFYDGKDGKFVYAGFLIKFSIDNEKINPKYVKYFLRTKEYWDWISSFNTGSTRGNINAQTYANLEIPLLSPKQQNLIAEVLGALDDKIECNNRINRNLEEQASVLFRRWFVDFEFPDAIGNPYKSSGGTLMDSPLGSIPQGWEVGIASDYFNISIGKTPPRAESQWFSRDNKDVIWVSIANMGNSGIYINNSTEYLTAESIKKFNVVLVPSNTVILSFKLTVGRVAITNGITTTNEAIAHFKTDNVEITEYLYLLLKTYDYQSMGSTSSIATAVNSKMVKAMTITMPSIEVLSMFHKISSPIFEKLKANQTENQTLATLRDTLLPKLMNNEITI